MTNWKRLYTDVSLMLDKYQNEVVPKLRNDIKELKADNERLRDMWAEAVSKGSKADSQIPRWIPVSERLPEQYESVIVWTSDRELGEAEYDGKRFYWTSDDNYTDVSHWMPLPEPPKEG